MNHRFNARENTGIILAVVAFLCGALEGFAPAQHAAPVYQLQYTISMPQPQTHLFEVRLEITALNVKHEEELLLQMPRWSPGRYAIFDFAKNVQEFSASKGVCPSAPQQCEGGGGAPLETMRADTQTWRIKTQGSDKITVRYKVFADDLSGTFSQLNTRHANFNGASIFRRYRK